MYASGLMNRETGQAIHRHTRFPTASVSKMFTSLCLARLMEAGVCSFEQTIVEIVPSLASHFDSSITISSLVSHCSGLGDYIDDEADLPFAGMDCARLDCLEAFLPLVLQVPRFEPGSFRYSSAGYILLGLVIEELTSLPFPDAISHWVTGPAGMTSTGFPRLDIPSADLAFGYLPDGSSNVGWLPVVGGPDGGIVSTVDDLARLFACLRSDALLHRETRNRLLRPLSRINERLSYGSGFYITHLHGPFWYGHTGSDPGLSARVAFSLHSDSSVVVLCNLGQAAFPVFRAILNGLTS